MKNMSSTRIAGRRKAQQRVLLSARPTAEYPKWKNGPESSVIIDTGVHIQLPKNIRGKVASKSGMMFNHDIITDGTVDPGYTGSIRVKLFNLGNAIYRIEKGQKIAQLILEQVITPELVVVEDLEETERGAGGFGSTGKF